MLTREEKQKLREEMRQRESRSWLLHDPSGEDVAVIIVRGDDMPWTFGTIEPLAGYEKYQDIFNEALKYHQLASEASDQNRDDEYYQYTEQEFEIYEKITGLGLKIWSKEAGGFVDYYTLNICGLEIEWK